MRNTADPQDPLTIQIERLQAEHTTLETAISALQALENADQLQIQRIKKRKLRIKDQITHLLNLRQPDIIA